MPWQTVLWLSKISYLNFNINITSGKGARVKRRGFYRMLYTEAEKVIGYSRRRVLNGETIPNSEKIMSLSDGSAAFIVKGNRE
ncbi:MAG: hypothetical protein KAR40_14375 [Candidatus Sabulitectum sp.]|nr:hypothetical protein [Candidatus Sabulitectum sp.]